MGADLFHRTRVSLLAKLRNSGNHQVWNQAWQRFFEADTPLMLAWCRRWGLLETDAQEIISNILARLIKRLKHFEYNPTQRFRGWLKTIIDHEVRDFLIDIAEHPGDYGVGQGNEGGSDVVADPARASEELYQQIEAQRRLLGQAMSEVRQRVEPHTWEAFHRTAVAGRAAAAVAEELGMTVVAVYKARSRAQELLRLAVARLREGRPTDPGGVPR